jgi:hypothetical protein
MTHATSNVEKTPPQPQQQPNKTQKTTQPQKQTHHKPQKKVHTKKNPQQQPKNNKERKTSYRHTACFIFCKHKCCSSIEQKF